ncbi:hypothetical protein N8333_01885 [Flavobacteriaceae bacterium]|nr:hypothetical protein [Flavobacteriaceae bacterium]
MKTTNILFLVFVSFFLFGMSGFALFKSNDRKINSLEVLFSENSGLFLSTEIVNKMLIQTEDSLFFQQKDVVALKLMEQKLLAHPMIKNVQLYTIPQGELFVEIEERTPVLRVIGETSFYIDNTGAKMPLSKRHTATVPLFYGAIETADLKQVLRLVESASGDSFLAQELIHLKLQNNQLVLGLRSHPFEVIWGKPDDFVVKINKLKRVCAYYVNTKAAPPVKLNLTYSQQVVASY